MLLYPNRTYTHARCEYVNKYVSIHKTKKNELYVRYFHLLSTDILSTFNTAHLLTLILCAMVAQFQNWCWLILDGYTNLKTAFNQYLVYIRNELASINKYNFFLFFFLLRGKAGADKSLHYFELKTHKNVKSLKIVNNSQCRFIQKKQLLCMPVPT